MSDAPPETSDSRTTPSDAGGRREPKLLAQAAILILAGAVLGLVGDLALPNGAIAQRAVIYRDLESHVSVKLHTPAEAVQLQLDGDAILLDARPREDSDRRRAADSACYPLEILDRYQDQLVELLTGRKVVVVLEGARSEEARELASRLVSGFSAESGATVEGGWEALLAEDDLVVVEGRDDS